MPHVIRGITAAVIATLACSAHGAAPMTVHELLQQEQSLNHKSSPLQPRRAADQVELIGIYGVQPVLLARIRHRGRIIEFRQGKRAAAGSGAELYQLQKIRPPCVLFRYRKVSRKVCLPVSEDRAR